MNKPEPEALTGEDWRKILSILDQYQHNEAFRDLRQKVEKLTLAARLSRRG